jgi:hypothetical protein
VIDSATNASPSFTSPDCQDGHARTHTDAMHGGDFVLGWSGGRNVLERENRAPRV